LSKLDLDFLRIAGSTKQEKDALKNGLTARNITLVGHDECDIGYLA